jgi:hypothetical protein
MTEFAVMDTNEKPMIKIGRLRAILDKSDETIRRWRKKNVLPPADIDLGGSRVWWHESTLIKAGFKITATPDQAEANRPMPASS